MSETILCVDDVPDNIKLLAMELEDCGYEVLEASSGPEALEIVKESPPHAIILDWMMPGMTGVEALLEIRKNYPSAELPVIMATALSEEPRVIEALEAGANDYVTKPISIEVLLARLEAHLRVRSLAEELKRIATTDYLTNLINRRHFFERAEALYHSAIRHGRDCTVMMVDADHFKKVNDTYGHEAGDEVLKCIASVLRESTRIEDLVARFGGEEFAVFCHETDVAGAKQLADRIRELVHKQAVSYGEHQIKFTLSIGISACSVAQKESLEVALNRADAALYDAKNGGRDGHCVFTAAST